MLGVLIGCNGLVTWGNANRLKKQKAQRRRHVTRSLPGSCSSCCVLRKVTMRPVGSPDPVWLVCALKLALDSWSARLSLAGCHMQLFDLFKRLV